MNKQSGLRAVVTLLLITVVMAGLLAAVNSITEAGRWGDLGAGLGRISR